MKENLPLLLVLILGVGCASPLYLRDVGTGSVYGPVVPERNQTIEIPGGKLELVRPRAHERDLWRILTTQFPEYDFRSTSIDFAVDSINRLIQERYPDTGVRVAVDLATFKHTVQDPFTPDQASYVPMLTFSARDASLMSVLDILCQVCEAHLEVVDETITIKSGSPNNDVQDIWR